ncbi:MAG: class I SAM-dependent methyltransferase [Microcoleaceae cyanobacterium]
MKINVNYRNSCRVCQSKNLHKIFSFPDMPLHDRFVSAEDIGNEFGTDLDIYFCLDCYTVQTQHDVDLEAYYEDYQYSVGYSQTARNFRQVLANSLISKYFPNSKKLRVLEVGSGDGSQLIPFKEMGYDVLGYEPSSSAANLAIERGIPTIKGFFNQKSVSELPKELVGNVDIILTSYTFDHLPEPMEFLQASKLMLNPKQGLLVTEVHDIEMIFSKKEPGLFQHEHSIYLNKSTVQSMLAREGYDTIDFDLVPESVTRANSLLFVSTLNNSIFSAGKLPPIDLPEFRDLDFYKQQKDDFYRGIHNLEVFLEKLILEGKKVAGYGAGPRGVLTLILMNNGDKIEYLIDKNPQGTGIYAPKSGVPVFGLDKLKESPVDEVIVFCFGYMKEVVEDLKVLGYSPDRLHSMIDITGGKIVR